MKLVLTETELAVLIPNISRVLTTGKEWEDKKLHYPAGAIITAILQIPGMTKSKSREDERGSDGFDNNGWQWDWWQRFDYNGKEYTLSGSGYRGGHTFGLSDEL